LHHQAVDLHRSTKEPLQPLDTLRVQHRIRGLKHLNPRLRQQRWLQHLGTQRNPGSVRNFWTYPPALNSTARLRHTVAELPGRQFQRCAPRAAFLPTSQARAAGIAPTTTSFSVAQLRIAQFAGTESVDSIDFAHAPPYSPTCDQTCWFRECMTD